MSSKLLDVKHQLIFYGKYHSNKYNVLIHICCVPLILWTSMIMLAALPTPQLFRYWRYDLSEYFSIAWTWATPLAAVYSAYYFMLEPIAALLYMPLFSAMFLSALPLASTTLGVKVASWIFGFSWVAQFSGHAFAEKRAPALLDNILGAVVLAPFFVHLEILFALGYRPEFHKDIVNGISVELVKYRREQAEARRAKND